MATRIQALAVLFGAALAMLGASAPQSAPNARTECRLDYQRADNTWAVGGRPEGNLGTERITLEPGQTKVFVTDLRYARTRNDGTNFYGSHLRAATNTGKGRILLRLRIGDWRDGFVQWIAPGQRMEFQHDLMEVSCPKQ